MAFAGLNVLLIITLMGFCGVSGDEGPSGASEVVEYNGNLTEYVCINLLLLMRKGSLCAVIEGWEKSSCLFSSVEKP